MNINSMNNDCIAIERSFNEQHSHVNNQQVENSTENQSEPKDIIKATNKVKKSPMVPTRL